MPLPEDLKMKLTFVALTHNIIKARNVTKEDEKIPRAVCNHYNVDYDRLPGGG